MCCGDVEGHACTLKIQAHTQAYAWCLHTVWNGIDSLRSNKNRRRRWDTTKVVCVECANVPSGGPNPDGLMET